MILDVGCGSDPHGGVNVDLLIPGDDRTQVDPRRIPNFVKAAAEALPFQDRAFAEVYSSHLLEHVQDPDICLAEFLRVASCRVRIILPCDLFTVFFNMVDPRNFFWQRRHHRRHYYLNPLRARNVRLRYVRLLDAALFRQPSFQPGLKIPIPKDTETVITCR